MTLSVCSRLPSAGGFADFFALSVFIVHTPHTPASFIERLSVLKNHSRGDKDFHLKMGGRVIQKRGLSIDGGG